MSTIEWIVVSIILYTCWLFFWTPQLTRSWEHAESKEDKKKLGKKIEYAFYALCVVIPPLLVIALILMYVLMLLSIFVDIDPDV